MDNASTTTAWDALQIGVQTGRAEVTITAEMVEQHLRQAELDGALFDDPHGGPRLVPPDLVPKLVMVPLYYEFTYREIGRPVRAKQGYTFLAPIHVGERIVARGRLVDKYERRGKRFVSFEGTFVDESGATVILDRRTLLIVDDLFRMKV